TAPLDAAGNAVDEMALFAERHSMGLKTAAQADTAAQELKWFGTATAAEAFPAAMRNFSKGAGFVGVTMMADNYLDHLFFGNNQDEGISGDGLLQATPILGNVLTPSRHSSWNTNSLLVPMAFASTEAGGWR